MPTELSEQIILVKALRYARILHASVPNGGKRNKREARALVASGMVAGVPDLLIFDRPPNRPEAVGVALELKRAKGGKVSEAQQRWLVALADRGWVAIVAHGAAEALSKLQELGYPVGGLQ